jgi:hypothetical protein
MIIEEIFIKLRMLQESNLNFQRSVRQLDMLSLLRGLQPLILKQEQKMALTLDIKNDLRYQQGTQERTLEIALEMLKEGLSNQIISRVTHLPEQQIEALRQESKRDKK